jgi:hypothetical protein
MKLTKRDYSELQNLLNQVHGTIACSIDPIENRELIKRFESDLRAISEFIKGDK